MGNIENINDYGEKFKSSVWKQVLKEFYFFKFLFISGLILASFSGVINIVQPKLINYVIDTFVKEKDISRFVPITVFSVFYLITLAAGTFLFIRTIGAIEVKMCHRLRTKCFNKLQTLSLSFYDKNSVGSLMSRMTSDINKLTGLVVWGMLFYC